VVNSPPFQLLFHKYVTAFDLPVMKTSQLSVLALQLLVTQKYPELREALCIAFFLTLNKTSSASELY